MLVLQVLLVLLLLLACGFAVYLEFSANWRVVSGQNYRDAMTSGPHIGSSLHATRNNTGTKGTASAAPMLTLCTSRFDEYAEVGVYAAADTFTGTRRYIVSSTGTDSEQFDTLEEALGFALETFEPSIDALDLRICTSGAVDVWNGRVPAAA